MYKAAVNKADSALLRCKEKCKSTFGGGEIGGTAVSVTFDAQNLRAP